MVIVGPCSIHDPDAGHRLRPAAAHAGRRAGRRSAHRHARLLREAAHHRGLEGPHQRSEPRRLVRDQRGAAAGPPPAAGPRRAGAAGRLRVPRSDHAAVHLRPGDVGRDRRAHDREPGAPRAGLRRARCRSASRTAPTAACRSPSTPCGPPRIRTASSASPSRAWPASCPPRGNPDCHVILRGGATGPNYDAISVQKTLAALRDAGLPPRVMIDASHGNSEKDHRAPAGGRARGRRPARPGRERHHRHDDGELPGRRPPGPAPTARAWSTARASPTRAWAGTRRCRSCTSWPRPCARAATRAADDRVGPRVAVRTAMVGCRYGGRP